MDFFGISGIIIAIFITHAISSDIWSKSLHSTLFRKESDEYANYLLWPMAHLVIKREKWNNSHCFKLLYCLLLSGCNVIAKQPTIYSIFRFLSFFIEEQRRIIPGLKFAINSDISFLTLSILDRFIIANDISTLPLSEASFCF